MSKADYYDIDLPSASLLRSIHKNGIKKAMWMKDHPTPSKALAFGSAYHKFILEETTFECDYFVLPKFGRSKDDQAAKKAIIETNSDKTAITQDDMNKLLAMREAMMDNALARHYLRNIETETEYFFELNDIEFKAKVDAITVENVLLELKSTSDLAHFQLAFFKYAYHIQAWLYKKVVAPNDLVFIAQDKEPPHEVRFFNISDEVIAQGEADGLAALEEYVKFKETGICQAYPEELEVI